MIVYLVRHGIAKVQARSGRDADRQLTSEGRQRVKLIAAGLARLAVLPDAILTSPYLRAMETARIIAAELNVAGKPVIARVLQPDLATGATARTLIAPTYRQVMLVGHEPGLSEMVGDLAGAGTEIVFKKGSVCRIDLPDLEAQGQLVWLLAPKVLAALGSPQAPAPV